VTDLRGRQHLNLCAAVEDPGVLHLRYKVRE
jgi:hypothetical protein